MTPPDHLMAGITIGAVYSSICGVFSLKRVPYIFLFFIAALFAVLPDADAFRGVYSSTDPFIGHRGITHSLLFVFTAAAVFTITVTAVNRSFNYNKTGTNSEKVKHLWLDLFLLTFFAGFSHLIMDLPQPPGVWKGIPLFFPLKSSGLYVRSGGWSSIGWYDYRVTYILFISVSVSLVILFISVILEKIKYVKRFLSLCILIVSFTALFFTVDHIRNSVFKGAREWNNSQREYMKSFHPNIKIFADRSRSIIFRLIR